MKKKLLLPDYVSALKRNARQLVVVLFIFAILVVMSFFFTTSTLKQQFINSAAELMRTAEANIRTNLREPEATLVSSVLNVRDMIAAEGFSQDDILHYLVNITNWLMENEDRVSGFNGMYGFIRGDYLDGACWEPPAGYVPQERPWFRAARAAKGEITLTEPYVDAETGQAVISVAQEIFSSEGEFLGVLALDVLLTRLSKYVKSLTLSPGGYGVLLNRDFVIISHPNEGLLDRRLLDLGEDYRLIQEEILAGKKVIARSIRSITGQRIIVFLQELYNGWYITVTAPEAEYYRSMYHMGLILALAGLFMMVMLDFMLLRLSAAQIHSDEENKSKSSFLARMSHEIRTPMNAIIGMSEIALRQKIPDETREYIVGIRQAGDNLLSIINDILDFSKIESGKLDINSGEYILSSLLGDCVSIIRAHLEEKALRLVTDFDPSLPNKLLGDEARLRQVTLNLLSNAVKYTREGIITFTVSAAKLSEQHINLIIKVADTGIGIKTEDMSKLFGEFTRLDAQKNRAVEGTGLGLVITRSLCQLMGGDITVESEYGSGSIFTASIPQTVIDASPFHLVEEKKNAGLFRSRFIAPLARVLVVDDLDTNLMVAAGLLAPYQVEVDSALSGEEAINLVKANHYDLVFMDHMMPGMDGVEAAARIRALDKEKTKNLPIVALTANAVSGMKEMFIEKGFNDFLAKPVDLAKLDEVLENWIPKQKQIKREFCLRQDSTQSTPATPPPPFAIAGLDTAKGIASTGGALAGYRQVLAIFCKDAKERLPLLAEPPQAAALPLFTTQVHALKSAAASIGAAELSAGAAALEAAGKAGDKAAIQAELPQFYTRLKTMADAIEAALGASGVSAAGNQNTPLSAELYSQFTALKYTLEHKDLAAADRLLAKLEETETDAETRKTIEQISNAVLMTEFEKALEIIKETLHENK